MSRRILIVAVTGHIGAKLAARLVQLGHQVTGIGRNRANFDSLGLSGVTFRQGDATDESFLTARLREADAAFVLIPPNFTAVDNVVYYDEAGAAIARSIRGAGIRYVVNVSSSAIASGAASWPIGPLHRQEQRLDQVPGLNVLHLRGAYFMENLLVNRPLIQAMGIMGSSIRADLPIPMVATRDMAEAAAEALDRLAFRGSTVQELLGPRDYTLTEVARIIGRAIGRPDLPYVQFSYEEGKQGMQQAGLPANLAELYSEVSRGMNEDGTMNRAIRTPQNTTPTTLEQFAQSVREAFLVAS
jgi:uncharacterized protein YbjT (DUF2867 family)